MKVQLKGDIKFVDSNNNWSQEIEVEWNKRITKITIKSRKLDLDYDFECCKLTLSHFITLLSYITRTRADAYHFYGTESKYSNVILESSATLPLMQSKNPTIQLKGKQMIFTGGVRKKDISSLSNVFTLNEMLMREIDNLLPSHIKN